MAKATEHKNTTTGDKKLLTELTEQVAELRADLTELRASLRNEVVTRKLTVIDNSGAERITAQVHKNVPNVAEIIVRSGPEHEVTSAPEVSVTIAAHAKDGNDPAWSDVVCWVSDGDLATLQADNERGGQLKIGNVVELVEANFRPRPDAA